MKKTVPDKAKKNDVHEQAIQRFDEIWNVDREGRELAITDRRFCYIAGAQWEDEFIKAAFVNKPRIEINKIQSSVTSIVSEYRQNRIGVNFTSKDGLDNRELSEICQGLYRSDYKASGGQSATDNCFEEGVAGGMGAIALTTELVDEFGASDSEQRVVIVPIFDADQVVFFDLNAKRYDKSDAMYAFKLNSMTRPSYEEEYDDLVANWTRGSTVESDQFDWAAANVVTVAEYYVIEKVNYEIQVYRNATGEREEYEIDDNFTKELQDHLKVIGHVKTKKVTAKRRQVRKYILSGNKILNGDGDIIPGTMIPIVPYYAKRNYISGIERFQGHVRNAKDAQILKNIMMSKLAETSAVSANSVPIVNPEQIAGHETDWAEQNVTNPAYLLLNPMFDVDGNPIPVAQLGRTTPPEIAPATAALLGVADIDLKEVTGQQEAAEVAQPNISGNAVELIQNKLDMRTYLYVSNMERTFQRFGEVWLDMAKATYVEDDRAMKVIGIQDDVRSVKLNEKTVNKEGKTVNKGDLSRANFDVEVNVTASTESKRAAMVRAFTGMASITQDPAEKAILMLLAAQSMEGEGLGAYKEYARKKLVAMGIEEPNDEDKKEMEAAAAQPKETSPADQVMLSEAEKDSAQAMKYASEADINVAKVANVEADTELKKAQSVNELDNVDGNQVLRILAILDQMKQEDKEEELRRQTAQPTQGVSNPGNPPGLNGELR